MPKTKPLIDAEGEVRELTATDLRGFKPAHKVLPAALQKTLDDTKVNPFEIKSKVTQNGATADMKGPWAGFRGLGISLGLRF